MNQGPNVRRLIAAKMSVDMVPEGAGLVDALDAMRVPGGIGAAARKAADWVAVALADVKAAKDNPHGDDDEAIAGEILRQAGADKGHR